MLSRGKKALFQEVKTAIFATPLFSQTIEMRWMWDELRCMWVKV